MKIFGWKARMKKLEFENTHLRNERDELLERLREELEKRLELTKIILEYEEALDE